MVLAVVGPLSKDPLAALCRQNLTMSKCPHAQDCSGPRTEREGDECLRFLMIANDHDCFVTVEFQDDTLPILLMSLGRGAIARRDVDCPLSSFHTFVLRRGLRKKLVVEAETKDL